jgi:hypothetical protein
MAGSTSSPLQLGPSLVKRLGDHLGLVRIEVGLREQGSHRHDVLHNYKRDTAAVAGLFLKVDATQIQVVYWSRRRERADGSITVIGSLPEDNGEPI